MGSKSSIAVGGRRATRYRPARLAKSCKKYRTQKKERRLAPPLRVEVLELRLRGTADPPRPFQLVRTHCALLLVSDHGTSTPAFFIDVSRPRGSAGSRLRSAGVRGSHPFSPHGPSGLRLPVRRPSAAGAASDLSIFPSRSSVRSPDLQELGSFRSSGLPELALIPTWRSVEACASWRLSQGIAFPFRVALCLVRSALAEPDLGDMLSTT